MENKITTQEEYEQSINQLKNIKKDALNLKIELFMNKKNSEKLKLLEEKQKVIKSKYANLYTKIKEYERENNIEVKKEGKKK